MRIILVVAVRIPGCSLFCLGGRLLWPPEAPEGALGPPPSLDWPLGAGPTPFGAGAGTAPTSWDCGLVGGAAQAETVKSGCVFGDLGSRFLVIFCVRILDTKVREKEKKGYELEKQTKE